MRFFIFVALVIVFAWCLDKDSPPENPPLPIRSEAAPPGKEYGENELWAEIRKAGTEPCLSRLRFTKIMGTWYLTCPECAAIPAELGLPRAIVNLVDAYAVGGKITLAELMRLTGEC